MKLATKTLLACTAATVMLASSAQAEIVTINYNHVDQGTLSAKGTNGDPLETLDTGGFGPNTYGLWGQEREFWTINGSTTGTNLTDGDGNATTVDFTFNNSVGGSGNFRADTSGPDPLTNQWRNSGGNNETSFLILDISGLEASTVYELLIYTASSVNITEEITANGQSNIAFTESKTNAAGTTYVDRVTGGSASNFTYFKVAADNTGLIRVETDGVGRETIGGFQIRNVPEPGSLALLGLGGLLIGARRRRG